MLSTETLSPAARHYRAHYLALARLLRSMRHEMATPLSASLLHLELLRRRLRDGASEGRNAEESLAFVEEGVKRASALLNDLGERARETHGEPATFALTDALERGARQHAEEAARRGVTLATPEVSHAPSLFGVESEIEAAVADVTRYAIHQAEPSSRVAWTISPEGEAAVLACRFSDGPAAEESRELPAELFPARWAVEAQGGKLSVERDRDGARLTMRFAPGGE